MDIIKMRYFIFGIFYMGWVTLLFGLDCPPDSAYYPDLDTTSATYGDSIATGLCACLDFTDTLTGNDSIVTLTVLLQENEPIRAFQFEIFDNSNDALSLDSTAGASVVAGDKILGWTVAFTETAWGSGLVLGFSLSGDTTVPGEEGTLVEINFARIGQLGEEIQFYLGGEGGVRISDKDAENVACNYPDEDNPVTFSTSYLSILSENQIFPSVYALRQNFPNPFNPVTTIEFQLIEESFVELNVYNVVGQRVATLLDRNMSRGYHRVQWNGKDQHGDKVASGIYIYTLKTDTFFDQKKMLLLQ